MKKYKIIYLEDNKVIRESLKKYLEENNFHVIAVKSISEFKSIFIDDANLVILDINLPDGVGYSLVEYIRNKDIPIIFLTVRDSEEDIIHGLNLGGDDYVLKPFSPEILKARINSVLRRVESQDNNYLSIHELTLDIEGTTLYIDNNKVSLSSKEYLLMECLFKNMGKTLTREKLIQTLWDYDEEFVNDNTLSVTIRRLREKIYPYNSYIKTIRGIGYKLDYEK